ncbi:MAG: hypothetical protein AB7I25_12535, partial [Vicinamibacterales bacterium]
MTLRSALRPSRWQPDAAPAGPANPGQAPEAIFRAANLNDVTPEIGRNKMFWPAAMAYDGARLWVGEYKFSNRVLR